ncbi:MAG: hypothetical protein KDA85_04240, partial [Planctomycetaceae bacterium]|nr:hypothetical protein [Planctomycetaceae bacterium]
MTSPTVRARSVGWMTEFVITDLKDGLSRADAAVVLVAGANAGGGNGMSIMTSLASVVAGALGGPSCATGSDGSAEASMDPTSGGSGGRDSGTANDRP